MVVLAFAEGSAVQLVPDGTIVIHIALILLMIWVLNRTFFRPVNRVIESRERSKGGRSSEAEETLRLAEEKRLRYETAMREARSEGYKMIESKRAAAIAERESRIEALKTETSQTLAREKSALDSQTEEARRALAAEAQKMAEKISSNILRA